MNKIKELRLKRNMKQVELCKILKVSQATLSLWENGKIEPDQKSLFLMRDFFGVTIDELLNGSENNNSIYVNFPASIIPLDPLQVRIPILGSVKAGDGGHCEENIEGYEYISAGEYASYSTNDMFWLRVFGDSMEPHLMAGDLVLVAKQTSVESGSLAVVCINGDEAIIKIVKHGKNWIELHSFNPYYPPRRFEGSALDDIYIIGQVKESKKKW